MNKRKCIVHIPYYLKENQESGSSFRPRQMVNAFKSIGYDVFLISGYSEDRKLAIKEIKERIKKGETFDFMYAESSTMPTLLTDKNHLPLRPTLDFGFFKFCKKHGIKIGLFYRDIFWKFPMYENKVGLVKSSFAKIFYRYDFLQYKKTLNVLFLASQKVLDKFPTLSTIADVKYLPPGANQPLHDTYKSVMKATNKKLTIFYVGGISGHYDITELLKVGKLLPKVHIVICCREVEWAANKSNYEEFLSDNIEVVHLSGSDLEPYYQQADIFSCFLQNNEYMDMAVPVKLFQYLSYQKPIISTKGTAAGDFVEENSIGWNIDYKAEQLIAVINSVINGEEMLKSFGKNLNTAYKENLWEERATYVSELLTNQ